MHNFNDKHIGNIKYKIQYINNRPIYDIISNIQARYYIMRAVCLQQKCVIIVLGQL